MMVTFKYKLYQSTYNKHLHKLVDVASNIYNHCIALHRRYYLMFKKYLNKYQLTKHIAKLKRLPKYKHWNQLGSQAVQDVVFRIDKAYQLFFKGLKTGKRVSPPGFKKRTKYRSFTLSQCGYERLPGNRVRIKDHVYKYFINRKLPKEAVVKTLTIKRDNLGDFYLFYACEVHREILNLEARTKTGKRAGFDFGLKTFLVSNTGKKYKAPEPLKNNLDKLRKLSRRLSKKKRGSNNCKRARLQLARLHRKVTNQRLDWHYKLARKLVLRYDTICLETLNFEGMKRLWGRKISDLAPYQFFRVLDHLANKLDCRIVHIDKWTPTTNTCHICGTIRNKKLKLSTRKWKCRACNSKLDRDTNSAKNILREGVSSLAHRNCKTTKKLVASSVLKPQLSKLS